MAKEVAFLQIIFFMVCGLSSVAIFVFLMRENDGDINYDTIINMMREQTDSNLEFLENGNKKIDKLEEEIRKYKKKLGFKLTKQK